MMFSQTILSFGKNDRIKYGLLAFVQQWCDRQVDG